MENQKTEEQAAFKRLLDIMDTLRAECPWDKKQTFDTLRPLTIEELYELTDALLVENLDEIKKELGDLMLHLVFYAKIGEEKNAFNITDVLNGICDKLIHRHPHIYSDTVVKDEKEVRQNWEKLKLKEGKESVLEGVPNSLPAVVKAYRIQEKVSGVGFDWDNTEQVYAKVLEELEELDVEVKKPDNKTLIEMEYGDLLFSLINYGRFIGVNPENALEKTNQKFIKRFQIMEKLMKTDNKIMSDMNLEDMDVYWETAKKSD